MSKKLKEKISSESDSHSSDFDQERLNLVDIEDSLNDKVSKAEHFEDY